MSELGIRIEGLRQRYGEGGAAVGALEDVDMTVSPGEAVGRGAGAKSWAETQP